MAEKQVTFECEEGICDVEEVLKGVMDDRLIQKMRRR